MREIFKKRDFAIIYCRRYVSMIKNHISGNYVLVKVLKKVRPFKVWLGSWLFIKMLLKAAPLFSKHFPLALSLCIVYYLFIKTRTLLQFFSQAFIILYMFAPFSFVFAWSLENVVHSLWPRD